MNDENYMLSYETLMEYTSFWALSISEMSNRDMTMGISSDDVVGVNACKWNEISDLWLPNLKRVCKRIWTWSSWEIHCGES